MSMRASEIAAVAAVIDPDAYAASTIVSAFVSMADFRQIMAVVIAGTLGAAATVDAKLEQATDSSGSGVKDITGKLITQLTQAGADDDKQAVINCRADELDVDNLFNHVRLSMTIAVAASDAGGMILGVDPAYGGASDKDAASVDEIVA